MSCRLALRFSPNPGAFTATTFTPARSLFTMRVARACRVGEGDENMQQRHTQQSQHSDSFSLSHNITHKGVGKQGVCTSDMDDVAMARETAWVHHADTSANLPWNPPSVPRSTVPPKPPCRSAPPPPPSQEVASQLLVPRAPLSAAPPPTHTHVIGIPSATTHTTCPASTTPPPPHLALHILCDDDERPLSLDNLLKDGKDGRKTARGGGGRQAARSEQ